MWNLVLCVLVGGSCKALFEPPSPLRRRKSRSVGNSVSNYRELFSSMLIVVCVVRGCAHFVQFTRQTKRGINTLIKYRTDAKTPSRRVRRTRSLATDHIQTIRTSNHSRQKARHHRLHEGGQALAPLVRSSGVEERRRWRRWRQRGVAV